MLPLLLFIVMLGGWDKAHAAPCPPPSVTAACVEWHEPNSFNNLKGSVITFSKNGVDLATINLPASSPNGGGITSLMQPTLACERATYRARGYMEFLDGTHGSEEVSIPAEVVKDRLNECPVAGPTQVQALEAKLDGICRAAKAMGGKPTTLAGRLRKEIPCP